MDNSNVLTHRLVPDLVRLYEFDGQQLSVE